MRNSVWPSSCVTPAGTSNELDVRNGWEENTHTHMYLLIIPVIINNDDYDPEDIIYIGEKAHRYCARILIILYRHVGTQQQKASKHEHGRTQKTRMHGIGRRYVCVCFLAIHSGHRVRWTYQPGSHRRKITQDFSSTFFLRCVP